MLLNEQNEYGRYLEQFTYEELTKETEDVNIAKLNLGSKLNFIVYESFFRTFCIYP